MIKTRKSSLIILSLIVSTGLTPIIIRLTQQEGMPSLVIILFRTWLVSLGLLPVVWKYYQRELMELTASQILLCAFAGLWLVFNLFSLFFALENTSVLVTSVLRRTTPLWIVIPEIILLGVSFTRRFQLSLFLTFIGVLFITLGSLTGIESGANPLLGAALACFGAISLGIYLIIGRKLSASMPSLVFSFIVFAWAALISSFIIWSMRLPILGYTAGAYVGTVLITIVAQILGHIVINAGLKYFSATAMSIILQIGVVSSAIMAFFILGETPTFIQVIGSMLVIMGIILITRN